MVEKLEAEFAAQEAEDSLRGGRDGDGSRSHDQEAEEAASEEALMALLEVI